MTFFVRAYLRASTVEQDAERARGSLDAFAARHQLSICSYYVENVSGAKLDRPELFRLLADSKPNDVLLVEDVDRLTRLTEADWKSLSERLQRRRIRVVVVSMPTTWQTLMPRRDEFDRRMQDAISNMFLEMLAAMARRDYELRTSRQKEGIAKAKLDAQKYPGKKPDESRYQTILDLLDSGRSWATIQQQLSCSRGTISAATKYRKRLEEVDAK